ncbi:transposase [Streptomyces chartreusis]
MGGVISADDPKWIEPFSGLSQTQFEQLVALVRRRGGDVQRGRPWRLPLADRVLLVPTRDRSISASSKNYRYSTNLQVVIDANSRLLVAIGVPLPGSRNDCRAFSESGVDRACRGAPVIADGGYQGTGVLIPHRKQRGQQRLSGQQEAENKVHRKARARVEHALSRLKNWKILRDCRLKGNGVHHAMLGIARLRNLALTG